MGLIIGEKNPKLVQSEDIGNLARLNYGKHVPENAIGEQDKQKEEEDATAKKAAEELKAQQEKESEEKAIAEREAKLEEIGKLPEEEQVAALFEAGFEEEANELSAKLAEKQGSVDKGEGEVDTHSDEDNGEKQPTTVKKGGRQKKS